MQRLRLFAAGMALALAACGGRESAEVDASAGADAQVRRPPDAAPRPDAGVEPDASLADAAPEACSPDSAEPNDAEPHDLGEFPDRPETTEVYTDFSLDSEADVDLYSLDVLDGGDLTNPKILVELREIPEGHDYALEVQFECGGEDQETEVNCEQGIPTGPSGCVSNEPDNASEAVRLHIGCSDTSTDEGLARIAIVSESWTDACAPYELEVNVD